MNIGRAIRILRETNEIPLAALARSTEISVSMLSMIENGRREPSLAVLRRIADALGIPLDILLAVAQPGEGTLASSSERARGFTSALRRLEEIEQEIRSMTSERVRL